MSPDDRVKLAPAMEDVTITQYVAVCLELRYRLDSSKPICPGKRVVAFTTCGWQEKVGVAVGVIVKNGFGVEDGKSVSVGIAVGDEAEGEGEPFDARFGAIGT
jgi:hypothetical protein